MLNNFNGDLDNTLLEPAFLMQILPFESEVNKRITNTLEKIKYFPCTVRQFYLSMFGEALVADQELLLAPDPTQFKFHNGRLSEVGYFPPVHGKGKVKITIEYIGNLIVITRPDDKIMIDQNYELIYMENADGTWFRRELRPGVWQCTHFAADGESNYKSIEYICDDALQDELNDPEYAVVTQMSTDKCHLIERGNDGLRIHDKMEFDGHITTVHTHYAVHGKVTATGETMFIDHLGRVTQHNGGMHRYTRECLSRSVSQVAYKYEWLEHTDRRSVSISVNGGEDRHLVIYEGERYV